MFSLEVKYNKQNKDKTIQKKCNTKKGTSDIYNDRIFSILS